MKTRLLSILLCLSFLTIPNHAFHLELDVYGLAYHLLGEGYSEAPRKLDDKAAWVFNPGIGISIDFRETIEESGFSPLAIGGHCQDCEDQSFLLGGGGVRYRHKMSTDYLFDVNLALVFSYAQDWADGEFNTVYMPLGNIGFSHRFYGRWWSYRLTYATENSGISATSGGDLLFMNLSVQL